MSEPLHALDLNEECCTDVTRLCPRESCAFLLSGKCMEAIYLLDKKYYPTYIGTIVQVSWHPVGHPIPDHEEHRRCLLSPQCELAVCRAQDATVPHCDPEILPHICPATTVSPSVTQSRSAENQNSGQNQPVGIWSSNNNNPASVAGSNIQNVNPGSQISPRLNNNPSGSQNLAGSQNNPGQQNVPSGSQVVPRSQIVPSGSQVLPGLHIVPSGLQVVPGSHIVPSGSQVVPRSHIVPSGAQVVPGSQIVPPGSRVEPGSHIVPSGSQVVPGSQNLPIGPQAVPGSQHGQNLAPESQNVPGILHTHNLPVSQAGPLTGPRSSVIVVEGNGPNIASGNTGSSNTDGGNIPNMLPNVVSNNSSSNVQSGHFPNMVPPNVVRSNNPAHEVSPKSVIPQQNNVGKNGHSNKHIGVRTSTAAPVNNRGNKNGVQSSTIADPTLRGRSNNFQSSQGDQNGVVRGQQPQFAIDGLQNASGTTAGTGGVVTQPDLSGNTLDSYGGIDTKILAGGIVGGALLALMMVCLTVCCVKRRRAGKSSSASTTSSHRGLHLQYSGFPLDSDMLNDPVYKSNMKSVTPPPPVPYRPPATNTSLGTSFREPINMFTVTASGISFGETSSESNDYEELPCELDISAKEAYDELVECRRNPNSRTPSNVSSKSQVKNHKIRSVPTLYDVNRRNVPKVVQRNISAREISLRNSIRPQLPLPPRPIDSGASSTRSSSQEYEPLSFLESGSGYEVPVNPGAAGQLAMLGVMHYPVTSAMYDVGTLKSGDPGVGTPAPNHNRSSTTPSGNQHYFVLEPQSGDGVVTISNGDCLTPSRAGSQAGSSQTGSQIYSPPSDHSYASVGHEYLDLQRRGGSWHSVVSQGSLNPDIRL